MNLLIGLVGLPRSGKTTWARARPWPIVSPDAIRVAMHGPRLLAEAEPWVWVMAKTMVVALFEAGHEIVTLDATNVTRLRRGEWSNRRWQTCWKVIEATVEDCMLRATGDRELQDAILRMSAAWEPLSESEQRYIG